MFGKNTAPAFGSFGAATSTDANTQAQPSDNMQTGATGASIFGSFGAGNQQQANANPGATSLFGGRPTSLFGNTTTQPLAFGTSHPAAPSPSLQNPPPTFGASSGGSSIFGPSTTGTGLFGQHSQQPSMPTTTPLFGHQVQQQQQQPTTTTSFMGQSTTFPQTQSTGPFGTMVQPASSLLSGTAGGLGLFGSAQTRGSLLSFPSAAPSASLFASRSSLVQTPGESAQAQFLSLVQRIETIVQSWDPNSPNCRFQYFFYNLVDPNQVHLYGRPPNAINDALWQKAIREDPDPTCMVPALALGFDDLQKRVEAQRAQTTAHQEKIKELKSRITVLLSAHSTANAPRLQRAAAVQTQIQQRLARLVQHIHLLIPSVRSSSIRPEEEALRAYLEALEEEIKRPGGVGRLKSKLSELWALIGAIEAKKEQMRKNGDNNVEWTVVDQEAMQKLILILAEQQSGIAHLIKIVQGHQKDLDIILGKPTQERGTDAFSNAQASQVLLGASIRSPQ